MKKAHEKMEEDFETYDASLRDFIKTLETTLQDAREVATLNREMEAAVRVSSAHGMGWHAIHQMALYRRQFLQSDQCKQMDNVSSQMAQFRDDSKRLLGSIRAGDVRYDVCTFSATVNLKYFYNSHILDHENMNLSDTIENIDCFVEWGIIVRNQYLGKIDIQTTMTMIILVNICCIFFF